jgi:hypothetical protein
VQGRLQNRFVSAEIETKCMHCDRTMHITADSDMHISVREEGAAPLMFSPDVDWDHFAERTIIDSY